MGEDEITEQIKSIPQKLSEILPGYPCDRCSKNGEDCGRYKDCVAWQLWFYETWYNIRRTFNRIKKGVK